LIVTIKDETVPVDQSNANLTRDTVHALTWRYAGAVIQGGLQFGIGVALARLLSPEAYGIVGMALIATGFGRLVGDFGFGAAIIQYPSVTQKHIRAALTGTFLLSIFFFLLLWIFAPTIARLFQQEALESMLRIIGLSMIFSAMSVTVIAVMRRKLQFRVLTGIESASYIVGFGGVGISMAILGYGAWSLVAANIIQPLCLMALGIYFIKEPVAPHLHLQEYRDLFRFAFAELLNNVVNFCAENAQFVVIGKWLGASALGLYNRSFHLMHVPVRYFSFALFSVIFPVYSKIQNDIPRLGRGFLKTVAFTSLITLPIFFAMAAAPEAVIAGLYGEQWQSAAGAFRILCLSGPFTVMIRIFGAVSHARGYVSNECSRQVAYLVLMGLSLWFLLPFGLDGAAVGVAIATFGRYLLLAQLSLKLLGIRWRELLLAQLPGYLLGLVAYTSAFVACAVGRMLGLDAFLQLVLLSIVSVVSVSMGFLFFPTSWFGDLYPWIHETFSKKLPAWLRRLVIAKVISMRISPVNGSAAAK
jgi:O-antigen/teichoic acid export membrane protein